jgi:hypothetical protein
MRVEIVIAQFTENYGGGPDLKPCSDRAKLGYISEEGLQDDEILATTGPIKNLARRSVVR